MRILIGSDHAGFELKEKVKEFLLSKGEVILDRGTASSESVDYPDFAHSVAQGVSSGEGDLGILICGSGNGVNMTANKHLGIRSALAWDPEVAALARQHNDANVLSLPARFITPEVSLAVVEAFLSAKFQGGRHQRRVDRIDPIA